MYIYNSSTDKYEYKIYDLDKKITQYQLFEFFHSLEEPGYICHYCQQVKRKNQIHNLIIADVKAIT